MRRLVGLFMFLAPRAASQAQILPPGNGHVDVERVTPDPMEVTRGDTATFKAKAVQVNAVCSAAGQYSSGATTFSGVLKLPGLDQQGPDSLGVVTFRWPVALTAGARGKIDVTCRGQGGTIGYLEPRPVYFKVLP